VKYYAWVNPVVNQVGASFVVPGNFGILAFGNFYQAFLAFDAIRTKNRILMFSICALNLCLTVFSLLRYFAVERLSRTLPGNYAQGTKPLVDQSIDFWAEVYPALLITTMIVGLCSIASSVLVFFLQREFSWAIYRHINGSVEMFRRYIAYEVRITLPAIVNLLIRQTRSFSSKSVWKVSSSSDISCFTGS
jgi:hypothetical protein